MVFHGRLSKDCAPCRKRKTRCDLVPTGCSQCRRAKITCHGYRTSHELMFRDETRNTMQKALASQQATRLPSVPQWSSDVSSREAFLSLYTGTYSYAYCNLQSLLTASGSNGHLQLSVDAVSLAFMAFQLNRQDLILPASQRYLAAVRGLGKVMRSMIQANSNAPGQSLCDVTLQSVLLLDLYEKMAYHHHQLSESPGHLLSHVRGAVSIVQSLPRGEFSNPTIQQLATQSVLAFTLSCGAAEIPIPGPLIRLYNDLSSYIQSGPWVLVGLFIRVINFRADVGSGKLDPSDIIERARDLYDELSDAENNIPCFLWPHRRDTCEAIAFNSFYDVYPGHNASQFFNAYRIMRLDMADIIQKCEPNAVVTANIIQVTRAICASVPAIILPAARPQNKLPLSPMQILECSAVLTPLYAAARHTQDPAMRAWILRTLMYMANNGVKLAKSVAYILTFKPQVGYWAVFRVVGNYAITSG